MNQPSQNHSFSSVRNTDFQWIHKQLNPLNINKTQNSEKHKDIGWCKEIFHDMKILTWNKSMIH